MNRNIFRRILLQLLRILILVIASVITIIDIITLPIYLLWQQPWLRWHLIYRNRSVQDPEYPQQLVRKSIKTMPEHFLNYCQTLDEAFEKAYEIYGPERQCLAFRNILAREDTIEPPFFRYNLSDYQWITWKTLMESMHRFGSGLRLLMQVEKGDRVMIFAETSHRWLISAHAIIKNGSVLTTLYSNLGNQGVLEAIKETEVQVLLTTRSLLNKLIAHPKNNDIFAQLRFIVLLDMNLDDREQIEQLQSKLSNNNPQDIQLFSYEEVLEKGDSDFYNKNWNFNKNDPDDLAMIMYTSGSGGKPKGVLMTHRNLLQGFQGHISLVQYFLNEIDRHVYIGYLPLAHILEFGTETIVLLIGAKLGYSSPHTLTDMSLGLMPGCLGDATLLKPTVMAAVPLVLDRIKKAILDQLNQRGLIVEKIFEFLVDYKTFWMCKGFQTPLLDWIFLQKFSKIVGGRLEALLAGGAPLSPDTQKWIRACLNVIFVQGYGATETVAGGLFMDEYDQSLAKVGGPLYGTKIKLVDWFEGGYTTTDQPNPRGEIHLSSKSISVGYFKLKHLDQEAYYEESNGDKWFRTGDIGEMFPNGTFKIIDRKKDFIKLQFGEYVSLGKIETKLKTSYLINQICVIGNPLQKYLIAIVLANPKALQRIWQTRKLSNDDDHHQSTYKDGNKNQFKVLNGSIPEEEGVEDIFTRKMIRHARRNGLRHYEIPKRYIFANEEWTPENGLVTASFKLKRKQIEKYYHNQIEQCFNMVNDEQQKQKFK